MQIGCTLLLAVTHLKTISTQLKITAIASLAAGLRVERRTIQYDNTVLAFNKTIYLLATLNQSEYFALLCQGAITQKFTCWQIYTCSVVIYFKTTSGTGASALLCHRRLITF